MKPPKLYHVAFSGKCQSEGFITDSRADANWTATGKPKSNCVPTIGDDIRSRLDSPRAKLPRRFALVFDSEDEAMSAQALILAATEGGAV